MLANVPQPKSAQAGICHGVAQYVGIGMSQKADPGRNFNSAQNQSTAFYQPVDVIPLANYPAKLGRFSSSFASAKSAALVIFRFFPSLGHMATLLPNASTKAESSEKAKPFFRARR